MSAKDLSEPLLKVASTVELMQASIIKNVEQKKEEENKKAKADKDKDEKIRCYGCKLYCGMAPSRTNRRMYLNGKTYTSKGDFDNGEEEVKTEYKFASNKLNNQKYNMFSFIFKVLYNEFKFFFNMFFLVITLS
jgi:Pyruvate/2-oxoacid:ferredoxin oxidoreductase delta subunit